MLTAYQQFDSVIPLRQLKSHYRSEANLAAFHLLKCLLISRPEWESLDDTLDPVCMRKSNRILAVLLVS